MTDETKTALGSAVSGICDNLCRWPRELKDEDALEEKCNDCRPVLALVNLVAQLDAASDTHTHTHRSQVN